MTGLYVPQIETDDDPLTAALKYAGAGWYLVPAQKGSKHPGSVVGKNWQQLSSRDPEVIVAWFAGTSHSIALHCGRSGAVVFDVDDPGTVPDVLKTAITRNKAPYQSTRTDVPHRGHYLFGQPPGRMLGNGWGSLGKSWGEVRGCNGVIIVAPSRHEKADTGGRYQWETIGPVPVLPPELAAALPEASASVGAAPDAVVAAFMNEHTQHGRPELLDPWCRIFTKDVNEGASRHQSMVSKACGAMKEAAAGLIDARLAADTLESMFLTAVGAPPTSGRQGASRTGAEARNEWAGILAWAVAQAVTASPAETTARASAKVRQVDPAVNELWRKEPPTTTQDEPPPDPQDTEDDFEGVSATDVVTWAPIDLTDYLDGTYEPVMPTLLTRTDGISLLYPGLVHSLHGESESGKSLVAQYLAAQQLMAGERVLFIDFESDEATIAERLLMFGAVPDAILSLFTYIRPEADPRTPNELPAWHAMLESSYVLAIIDGVTDSLGMFGYASKDNDDVASWMRILPKNVARCTGATVAVIDHVIKDTDGRGRFAIGAQAKMSGLTGAGYTIEVAEALGRGLRGVIVMRVGKDRLGYVRGQSGMLRKTDRTQESARITVDSTIDPDHPVVTVDPWRGSEGITTPVKPFRLTGFMERISKVLEGSAGSTTVRGIRALISGNYGHISFALETLISEGHVSRVEGPNRSQLHAIITPYRQSLDPLSDMFPPVVPSGSEVVPKSPVGSGSDRSPPLRGPEPLTAPPGDTQKPPVVPATADWEQTTLGHRKDTP